LAPRVPLDQNLIKITVFKYPTNQLTNRPTNQPIDQPASQPASQPISQPTIASSTNSIKHKMLR